LGLSRGGVVTGVVGVMTGPWLIVKWMGIAALLSYTALLVVAIRRFRDRLTLSSLSWPIVIGNFISLTLPRLFMKAEVTRTCFVVAQGFFIYGIVVLLKNFAPKDQTGLLKLTADS